MEGEFNNLNINNTNITFSVAPDNTALSDETTADPIYQRQMGTKYARGKRVGKAVTIAGISIAFTATAVSTGSVLKNAFVPDPPSINSPIVEVVDGTLNYSFTVVNKNNYITYYKLDIDNKNVLEELCTEAKEYKGTYSPIPKGSSCKFYITFTNSLDYYKVIYTNEFVG